MGIWDKLKGELIDIVEWTGGDAGTMVCKFERYGNEIKNGAKLVVREGQVAVFVNEGKIADVFQPGMYELTTRNLPILSTLLGWKHGFESPFKAEVYFVVTRRFTDLKWGTKNPVMMRDAEFGPVRLRAFGTYVMQVKDPAGFVRQVAGTDAHFTAEGITEQLRNTIVSRFSDLLGESRIPVLDMAGNYDELGKWLRDRIAPDMAGYGVDLCALLVENVSLPPEVEAAMDKRSSMGVIGDMSKYTQYQTAEAIRDAAQNPAGGMAAGGMGMGMGFAMGQQMSQQMAGANAGGHAPPIPGSAASRFFVAVDGKQVGPFDLTGLRQQIESGKLTRETLVWREGMAQWTAAGEVGELKGMMPPSIPGR